jgi:hypothetical protein
MLQASVGSGVTGVAGSVPLPVVTVTMSDRFGNALVGSGPGVTVGLGGGAAGLAGTTSKALRGGSAVFDDLRVGNAGDYTLVFTTTGLAPVSVKVGARFARPTLVIDHAPASLRAGESGDFFQVTPEGVDGTPLPGSGKVKLSIVSGPRGAKLLGTTVASLTGTSAFFSKYMLKTAGDYVLGFTMAGGVGVQGVQGVQTQTITVTPGDPAKLVFSRQPVRGPVSSPVSVQLQTLDKFGNVAPGSTAGGAAGVLFLQLSKFPRGAILSGTVNPISATGVFDVGDLSVTLPGSYVLKGAVGALSAVSAVFVLK